MKKINTSFLDMRKIGKKTELYLRVGTFKEDIFSKPNDPNEFDVLFYYDSSTYPVFYYYDNIEYKYRNTVETLAQHMASGDAEESLWRIYEKMEDDDYVFLVGLSEPICSKEELDKRIDEIKKNKPKDWF